jgi:hypothetical protein
MRTRIILKLGAIAVMMILLILFAATKVDFVYTGF